MALGGGPRALQYLVLSATAPAAMDGRPMADLEDLAAVVLPVLRHRIVVNFNAEASGKTADEIVREVQSALRAMPQPVCILIPLPAGASPNIVLS